MDKQPFRIEVAEENRTLLRIYPLQCAMMRLSGRNWQSKRALLGLALGSVLMSCAVGSGDTARFTVPSEQKSLPITLRDVELEFAAAQRAKLDFYSPRFFQNARRAYDRAQFLRRQKGSRQEVQKYLDLIAHNLSRAYASKELVLFELGGVLAKWQQIEENAAFRQFPQRFEHADKLLKEVIELLELKQINPVSWEENHHANWLAKRQELEQMLISMLGIT